MMQSMKIYESIPEDKGQRIRGYWIECRKKEIYNWKEISDVCHEEFFDKVEAQKAERRILAMRQGECQIFVNFLQDWEVQ